MSEQEPLVPNIDGEPDVPEVPEPDPARKYVMLAWLMLPLLVVSLVGAVLFAVAMGELTGIDAIDPLADQGVVGWLVFIVSNLILWPLPSYFGLRCAMKARELGARSRAFVPLIAHAFVIFVIWALSFIAVLQEF